MSWMKEDSARNKWCPMSRRLDATGQQNYPVAHNRFIVTSGSPPDYEDGGYDVPIDIGNNCMGRDCAFWIWEGGEEPAESEIASTRGRCGMVRP